MLTEEQMSRLLAQAVADQAHRTGARKGGRTAVKLLKSHMAEAVLPLPPSRDLEQALAEIGDFLERAEDHWTALVPCGAGDMNRAVLVAAPEGETLRVRAWAKEGLINQHAAEKAVEKLKAALL